MDINEQAEPERLHEMEDESLLSIQESEFDEVSIEEVHEGPHVERHLVPQLLQPQHALIRVAERTWSGSPRQRARLSQCFFLSALASKLVVLRDPEHDVELLA